MSVNGFKEGTAICKEVHNLLMFVALQHILIPAYIFTVFQPNGPLSKLRLRDIRHLKRLFQGLKNRLEFGSLKRSPAKKHEKELHVQNVHRENSC